MAQTLAGLCEPIDGVFRQEPHNLLQMQGRLGQLPAHESKSRQRLARADMVRIRCHDFAVGRFGLGMIPEHLGQFGATIGQRGQNRCGPWKLG